jgi:hypothetical protein
MRVGLEQSLTAKIVKLPSDSNLTSKFRERLQTFAEVNF